MRKANNNKVLLSFIKVWFNFGKQSTYLILLLQMKPYNQSKLHTVINKKN